MVETWNFIHNKWPNYKIIEIYIKDQLIFCYKISKVFLSLNNFTLIILTYISYLLQGYNTWFTNNF